MNSRIAQDEEMEGGEFFNVEGASLGYRMMPGSPADTGSNMPTAVLMQQMKTQRESGFRSALDGAGS